MFPELKQGNIGQTLNEVIYLYSHTLPIEPLSLSNRIFKGRQKW